MVPGRGYDPRSSALQAVAMTTSANQAFKLEHPIGVEPMIAGWKPAVLPLY